LKENNVCDSIFVDWKYPAERFYYEVKGDSYPSGSLLFDVLLFIFSITQCKLFLTKKAKNLAKI